MLIHGKNPQMTGQGQSAFDVPVQITEAWMLLIGRGQASRVGGLLEEGT